MLAASAPPLSHLTSSRTDYGQPQLPNHVVGLASPIPDTPVVSVARPVSLNPCADSAGTAAVLTGGFLIFAGGTATLIKLREAHIAGPADPTVIVTGLGVALLTAGAISKCACLRRRARSIASTIPNTNAVATVSQLPQLRVQALPIAVAVPVESSGHTVDTSNIENVYLSHVPV